MPDQGNVEKAAQFAAENRRLKVRSRVALTLVPVVVLTSCVLAPEPEPVSNQQSVKPAELKPDAAHSIEITRNDQVILLPHADGSVGSIVVRQDGVEIVLDKAYASAVIEGPGQIRQLVVNPSAAKEMFAAPLGALPLPPASYMLYFVKGTDELTAESKKEVEKVLAELARRPAAEISVIGHTDTVGSGQFNDNLSLQRAKRVRQLLVSRGIPLESIAISGRGERELLIPTPDKVHEPRNRSVEIGVK
ncbi:MAG TPA: OmpA family protein [Burkholderiales bacterium]|jgi:outer membrane protein OmpA-like peptidoglycan-associated protein|nr:OmpA family protein [Burkholderiales bacterium]